MSMTELKLAISNAGLCGESEGFVERSEFITLLNSHRDVFCGQDECPVCFLPMNFGMKSILLPCKHRLCENCLTSIVSREDASCVCPMCRASVSETSLAIGMKNAGLTASALFGGYNGAVKTRILDRAEAQFREALRRDPHHAGFLTTLADLVLDKGDAREAGVLCRRAIYYEPANYVGFASLGHVLTAMDDLEGAIRCYEKALSLKEHPDVVSNLGNAYFAVGNVAAALAKHRRAVDLDPDNSTVVFNLGVTLEEGNVDIDEAIRVYERALSLDAAGSSTSPPGCMQGPISAALAEARGKKRSQEKGSSCTRFVGIASPETSVNETPKIDGFWRLMSPDFTSTATTSAYAVVAAAIVWYIVAGATSSSFAIVAAAIVWFIALNTPTVWSLFAVIAAAVLWSILR